MKKESRVELGVKFYSMCTLKQTPNRANQESTQQGIHKEARLIEVKKAIFWVRQTYFIGLQKH